MRLPDSVYVVHLTEPEREGLGKMLSAAGLGPEDADELIHLTLSEVFGSRVDEAVQKIKGVR